LDEHEPPLPLPLASSTEPSLDEISDAGGSTRPYLICANSDSEYPIDFDLTLLDRPDELMSLFPIPLRILVIITTITTI